jgi:hypothetical protein
MPRYSVIINWNDRQSDEGTFGWSGKAENEADAEKKARDDMRAHYVDNYGADDEAEAMADDKQDGDEVLGGSLVDITTGAAWKAQDLEDKLTDLLRVADEVAARCGWVDNGEREAARKLIADLDRA